MVQVFLFLGKIDSLKLVKKSSKTELTRLHFSEIFDLQISAELRPKISEISGKREMVETFFWGYVASLRLVE